jgi:hypothetical protein
VKEGIVAFPLTHSYKDEKQTSVQQTNIKQATKEEEKSTIWHQTNSHSSFSTFGDESQQRLAHARF